MDRRVSDVIGHGAKHDLDKGCGGFGVVVASVACAGKAFEKRFARLILDVDEGGDDVLLRHLGDLGPKGGRIVEGVAIGQRDDLLVFEVGVAEKLGAAVEARRHIGAADRLHRVDVRDDRGAVFDRGERLHDDAFVGEANDSDVIVFVEDIDAGDRALLGLDEAVAIHRARDVDVEDDRLLIVRMVLDGEHVGEHRHRFA